MYGARGDDWWAARGLDRDDWHALAANTLVEAFDSEVVVALEAGAARLQLERGEAERAWGARCGGAGAAAPPDVVGAWRDWCGAWLPRVRAPALEVSAFSPRATPHPPLPPPAAVALVLHNRESDNPVPLDSELCAEILRSLEDAPDCDDKRGNDTEEVERYRGGGSSSCSSSGSPSPAPPSPLPRGDSFSRVGACRWTLTGRGVRADLASPEDVSLGPERHGTSV